MQRAPWMPLLLAVVCGGGGALLASSSGCVRQGAFHCVDDTQCTLDSTQGHCEAVGFCSFPDAACDGGFRFGEHAGSHADECVPFDGFVEVGGTVTGLVGGLVLRNNGGDDLFITADGPFTFQTVIPAGSAYNVTLAAEPAAQACRLANASGTAGTRDITDITVTCVSDPGILCGTGYCNPASEICCIMSGIPSCTTSCTGAGNRPIRCDDHQDCVAAGSPNGVCCGALSGTTVNNTVCTDALTCTAGNAYFCDPNIAVPCPDGGTCMPTNEPFPGYYRCY
jgi:hypothetical protein